jgi:hypothetical protein
MSQEKARSEYTKKSDRQPYRVHLPGFVTAQEVGLGDVIKRVTHAFAVKPCSSCERRADQLNRWLVFAGRAK